jgi:hypothetical protein
MQSGDSAHKIKAWWFGSDDTVHPTWTTGTDDCDETVRVVQPCIDGFNDNEISKSRETFDEDAWMYYINAAGVLRKSPISESLETWATPPAQVSWAGSSR